MTRNINFLHLPIELTRHILLELPFPDLFNAFLTCHQIKTIAEPILYQSVTLHSPLQNQSFAQALAKKPERASWVRSFTLEVAPPIKNHHGEGIYPSEVHEDSQGDENTRVLGLIPSLKHLKIKSPPVSHEAFYLRTLHFHYWFNGKQHSPDVDFSPFANIFLHPSLESVTIAYMAAELPFAILKSHKFSSPLKKLRIVNSIMTFEAIASIIHVARNLQELEITTFMAGRNIPWNRHWLAAVPSLLHELVACIVPAQHTLEKLVLERSIEFRPPILHPGDPSPPLLFGEFTALKHFEVKEDYILGEGYKDEYLPHMFPPKLEALKFICRAYHRRGEVFLTKTSSAQNNWAGFAKFLGDEQYLQHLRKIVFKMRGDRWLDNLEFPVGIEDVCRARQIDLLYDAIKIGSWFSFHDHFDEEKNEPQ